MMRLLFSRLLLLALVLVAVGCGGERWPTTAPVTGTVTFDGKPVAGVNVGFQSSGAPRYGYGTTDSAGRYSLSTFEPGDGGIIGEHVVVITPGNAAAVDDLSLDMSNPENYEAYKKAVQAADRPPKNPAVPARYGSPSTSPLKANVKPGENVIDFDLTEG